MCITSAIPISSPESRRVLKSPAESRKAPFMYVSVDTAWNALLLPAAGNHTKHVLENLTGHKWANKRHPLADPSPRVKTTSRLRGRGQRGAVQNLGAPGLGSCFLQPRHRHLNSQPQAHQTDPRLRVNLQSSLNRWLHI